MDDTIGMDSKEKEMIKVNDRFAIDIREIRKVNADHRGYTVVGHEWVAYVRKTQYQSANYYSYWAICSDRRGKAYTFDTEEAARAYVAKRK